MHRLRNPDFAPQLFITTSTEETETVGAELAPFLAAGNVLALKGQLGSGKTTFTRGLCRGLGVEDDVTSPTFTLVNEYYGKVPVYHFDFYRLASSEEVWSLGCEEYFQGDGICVIEWPERASEQLPEHQIEVRFRSKFDQGQPDEREIIIQRT